MRFALAVLLLAGCSPRLYTEGDIDAQWVAPENDWPLQSPPEELRAEGFAEGQLAPDVRGVDQFGDEVSMWQFYGRYILLDISTMWCGPCQELARGTEATAKEFEEDGVIYLTVLHENVEKEPPSIEELNVWAQFPAFHHDEDHPYELITSPIIADPYGESGSKAAVRNGQYPVALLIGPDMQVIDRIEPVTDQRVHEVLEDQVR
jgi:thiol-disulfide isomerase/thioredoxin